MEHEPCWYNTTEPLHDKKNKSRRQKTGRYSPFASYVKILLLEKFFSLSDTPVGFW